MEITKGKYQPEPGSSASVPFPRKVADAFDFSAHPLFVFGILRQDVHPFGRQSCQKFLGLLIVHGYARSFHA